MILFSCLTCRTQDLTPIALTDADASRVANSGETCCAAPESPAGRLDTLSPEAVVGGLAASGDQASGAVVAPVASDDVAASSHPTATVERGDRPLRVSLPRAMTTALLADVTRNLSAVRSAVKVPGLSGVPAWAARRWTVGR